MLTMWTAVTCASQNIAQVLVFRCLSGLFGSSPLSNAGGTIADVLDQKQRGIGMGKSLVFLFFLPKFGDILFLLNAFLPHHQPRVRHADRV